MKPNAAEYLIIGGRTWTAAVVFTGLIGILTPFVEPCGTMLR